MGAEKKIVHFKLSGCRQFNVGSVHVQVQHALISRTEPGMPEDAEVVAVTEALYDRADGLKAVRAERDAARTDANAAREELRLARAELDRIRAAHPLAPVRLLGVGAVRFDERGRLWILNNREKGWSSFGVQLDGWDELFRRFDVVVAAHGEDEHGVWFDVVNNEKERT